MAAVYAARAAQSAHTSVCRPLIRPCCISTPGALSTTCSRANALPLPLPRDPCRASPRPLPPPEHDHAGDRSWPAHVVREAELRVLHLPLAGLAAELHHTLGDHADAARANRMAERLEAAARVDR